jgi:hypothetical protein
VTVRRVRGGSEAVDLVRFTALTAETIDVRGVHGLLYAAWSSSGPWGVVWQEPDGAVFQIATASNREGVLAAVGSLREVDHDEWLALHAATAVDDPCHGVHMSERGLARSKGERATVELYDGEVLVAVREAEIRFTDDGTAPRRVEGRLLGGVRAARDIPPRRLMCVSPVLEGERRPCVVRTYGEIHFLPVVPPASDLSLVTSPTR